MTIVTKKVLLVDDCQSDLNTYQKYLQCDKQRNYSILQTRTGEQALLLCKQQFPDAIIMDYLLPDMDALEFLDNLKNQFGQNFPAVIILTGRGNEQIAVKAMKGGVADYLVKKQTTAKSLCLAVENILENTRQSAEAEVELRRRERQFSTLVENLPDVIFRLDCDLRHIYISPQVVRESGMAYEAFLGKTGRELGLPKDACDVFEAACYEALANKQVTRVEYSIGVKQYSSRLIPEQGEDDIVVSLMGITEDITDRKCREANLVFLAEIAHDCLRLSSAEEIMQVVGAKIGTHLNATTCNFCEIDESRDEMIYLGRWNIDSLARLPDRICLSEQMSKEFCHRAHAGETIVRHNTQTNLVTNAAANAAIGGLSFITVPFHKDGGWKYLFSVHDQAPRTWREDEIELVCELANRLFPRLERARSEAALRENEQLLRLTMAGAQAGSWDWNLAMGKLTWSFETYHLYGLDPAQGLPEYEGWYNKLLHPSDRDWVNAHVMQVLEQRQPEIQIEFRIIHPQRGIRWLLSLGRLIFNEQDEAIRLSGINLDITERKQAQEKICEQAALLDVASDAIFVRDLEYRILYWNSSAESIYGWQLEEVIGRDSREFLYSQMLPKVSEALRTVIEQGKWEGELNKITKSGQEIIVESRWTLMRGQGGQPKSILTVDSDITEKKHLEAQFHRAQRLESLGTLASGISHDLNNILTPILGVAQLLPLKLTNLSEQNQQLLKILEENSKRGAELVKQITVFARGTEGIRVTLQPKHLLKEIEGIVRNTFPKSIEICVNLATQNLFPVLAEPTQMHQILMNLCINARDAMPNGGTLTISAENLFVDDNYAKMTTLGAKVGNYVVITISDTGCGIPPEIKERIFEPFFTTKELGKGTGLGLSTVIGIIKNHGGFVNVHSSVGKGSQFKVYLSASNTEAIQSADSSEIPLGNGELILVIDDEASVREITKTSLLNYNYRVLTGSNAIDSFSLYALHNQEISLVLMDIEMPLMDGLSAIRILQQMNPNVKIIAISGGASSRQLLEVNNVEVQAFLLKPYTIINLMNSIKSVLSR